MTLCPWCGQQSQSDINCDWCKRPISSKMTTPAQNRSELDFLREESEGSNVPIIRIAAGVICAVAIGVLMFILLKPAQQPEPIAQAPASGDAAPSQSDLQNRRGGAARAAGGGGGGTATLVSEPRYQARPQNFWIQNWDPNTADLISNARGWRAQSPRAQGSADVTTNIGTDSKVRFEGVSMSLVALPGGQKRLVGKADIVNTSDKNVVDYRCEVAWGPYEYMAVPLEGTKSSLRIIQQRAIRPGKKVSVQLVSQKIKNNPSGAPTSVRLMAWLDGPPGNSMDEFQLQYGR